MSTVNPYNFNLPVEPNMFFGRDGDVTSIYEKLTASPGDSVALIGGRRMGKTSLLEALKRKIESENQSGGTLLAIPIMIDFNEGSVTSEKKFYEIATFLSYECVLRICTPFGHKQGQNSVGYLKQALPDWATKIFLATGKSVRFIFLLDECERISDKTWSKSLFGSIRSLLIGPETKHLVKIVMTGAYPFLTQIEKGGSPLNNILQYHKLNVLNPKACKDLIEKPCGYANQLVEDEVYRQSGGHPFLTQYLMHKLCEMGLDKSSIEVVQSLVKEFHNERPLDFAVWMEHFGDTGADIYCLISSSSVPLNEDEIIKRIKSKKAPLILDALSYYGLIRKNSTFTVTSHLFKDWYDKYYYPTQEKKPKKTSRTLKSTSTHIYYGPYYDQSTNTGDIDNAAGVGIGAQSTGSITTNNQSGLTAEDVTKIFSVIWEKVGQLEESKKQSASTAITALEKEAAKGDQADETQVRAWTKFLAEIAPDVFDVAIAAFANPVAGLGLAFRKIAEKAKNNDFDS